MDVSVTLYHDTRRALKDGRFPIRIRVTYRGYQRYYKTGYSLDPEEFEILISAEILKGKVTKALQPLRQIRKKLDERISNFNKCASGLNASFTWNRFNSMLAKEGGTRVKSGKVYEYFDRKVEELEAYEKIGTADSYRYARNKFKEYRPKLNFDDVTPEFLNGFQRWMIKEGKSRTTVGFYMRAMRAMYNDAIKQGDANKLLYPFEDYTPPTSRKRKIALELEDMKKFFDYPEPKEEWKAKAWAMFKFSYLTSGMNLTDIANLKHSDIKEDFFTYDRIKTVDTKKNNEPIEVHLLPETKKIIQRYGTGWKNRSN
jgi:hypothetical protein